ncbi:Hypothetical protein DHA2_154386 [Giardia duodenalis]|uniref:SET domain-containing protein n=1 Tax=Giardia intestinalis TaxID=5741 RepID=V6TCP9_GIAIN|nr:Hypothetical protein DHA2_154386 [Giardia intestinalis]
MNTDLYAHYAQLLMGTNLEVRRSLIGQRSRTNKRLSKRATFRQGEMKGLFLTENAEEGTQIIVESPLICWLHPSYVKEVYTDKQISSQHGRTHDEFDSPQEQISPAVQTPRERLDLTARNSLSKYVIQPTNEKRYCFCCLSSIKGQPVPCKHRKENAFSCRHEYCSENCRERHYILGHVALCVSLWPDIAEDILHTIHDCPELCAPFSAYNVLEIMAQIMCKEAAYLMEIEDEALSLQYAFMYYAYLEPGNQARKTKLSSSQNLPNVVFPDIGRVFEKLIPDVSFAEHYFLLTRATLLGAQMFNYFVCILLTNSYSIEDKTGQEIGAGLYSLISCCNHSCTPNAQVIFGDSENAREATLVLLRPCAQKEELYISYITDLGRSVVERRRELAQWCFTCQCTRCLAELSLE